MNEKSERVKMMQEKPILFSSSMVHAILDGRKTQTRRVIKPQPKSGFSWLGWVMDSTNAKNQGCASWQKDRHDILNVRCPYGQPGDHLWVKETWSVTKYFDDQKPTDFLWIAEEYEYPEGYIFYRADGDITNKSNPQFSKWRPSIFMPRQFSRINLEITEVRVEQLQQIANHRTDCLAEGIIPTFRDGGLLDFIKLWDSINAKRGYAWETNPWVWVVEFERVK